MILVGSNLKKIRLSKKINLINVCNDLKISKTLLKQIENDDFQKDVSIVYLTGHIRAYANYLDLDSDEVIKRFKEQTSFIDYKPLQVLAKPIQSRKFFLTFKNLSFASVLFISFGFYFLFIKPNDLNPNYASIPTIPENLIAQIEEVEMNEEIKNFNKVSNINTKSKIFLEESDLENIVVSKSSAIASIPNEDKIDDNYKVLLRFLKPTWIQLRDSKDEIILSKLMNKNEEYVYFSSKKYFLTVGNAGNVLVMINEDSRGKLGKSGEVVESLMINFDFNN